jgi:hypothetical protein
MMGFIEYRSDNVGALNQLGSVNERCQDSHVEHHLMPGNLSTVDSVFLPGSG